MEAATRAQTALPRGQLCHADRLGFAGKVLLCSKTASLPAPDCRSTVQHCADSLEQYWITLKGTRLYLMSMHLRHMDSASWSWLASLSRRARLFRLQAVRGSSDPNDRSLITKLRRASASASSKLQETHKPLQCCHAEQLTKACCTKAGSRQSQMETCRNLHFLVQYYELDHEARDNVPPTQKRLQSQALLSPQCLLGRENAKQHLSKMCSSSEQVDFNVQGCMQHYNGECHSTCSSP